MVKVFKRCAASFSISLVTALTLFATLYFLSNPKIAQAIDFDKLEVYQSVAAIDPTLDPQSNTTPPSDPGSIIGGYRYILVRTYGPTFVNATVSVPSNLIRRFSHSQDDGTSGHTFVIWDGNPSPGIQFTGLGGVNLLEDGATAFRLGIKNFDFAFSKPLAVTFAVYDASDPNGEKVSFGTINLNQEIQNLEPNMTVVELPFSSLVNNGKPADLTNVGAITLFINGNSSTGSDLSFGTVGTNGDCTHVPVNGLVLDQCKVCNGDNTSCADCLGVPNGKTLAGTYCSTGKLGVCGDGTYSGKYPTCQCVPETTPSPDLCDGVDRNCDGIVEKLDQCGVCGGNGQSCVDCKGTPFGTTKVDSCGVCGGDNTTCISCDSDDQQDKLEALDGGAKEQEKIIIKAIGIYRKLKEAQKPANRLFVAKTLSTAHNLQVTNWTLAWQLPFISVTCTENPVCVTTSNLATLTGYRTNNEALRNLALSTLDRIKKANKGKVSSAEAKLRSLASKQFQNNLALSRTVPELQYSCVK